MMLIVIKPVNSTSTAITVLCITCLYDDCHNTDSNPVFILGSVDIKQSIKVIIKYKVLLIIIIYKN